MSPIFASLLAVTLFAASTFAKDGYFYCDSEKEHCCKPFGKAPPNSATYDPLGKCFAVQQNCPQGYYPSLSCGRFKPESPPTCDNGCCVAWALNVYTSPSHQSLTPGLEYQCRAPGATDCGPQFHGQVFTGAECQNNFPNKNVKPQPKCSDKEYCCRQYAGFQRDGSLDPGLETKCQAAGTGCPQGMVGSSDVDCNLNYPNWGIAPVPKMPVDCPKGKYACVEYAERSKKRTLDGLATSCQDINQACPPGYDGFSTTSFKGIWPNKRVQPAPKDCPKSEYCCLEPPRMSQSYPNAAIGGGGATCRKDKLKPCPEQYRIAFATNACSTLVPNFNNNTLAFDSKA